MARKRSKTDKREDAPVDENDILDAQLFKEVDEEVRRDRYTEIWKRYGRYIIGAAAAVVLATAAVVFYQRYQTKLAGEEGERYAAAVSLAQAGKTDEAVKALAAVAAKSGKYKTMARFQEAAIRAEKGEVRQAVAIYDRIAADSSADAILRDLARLLSVLTDLDTGKPDELTAKIAPLAKGDGPWHHSALELTGLLAQKSGDVKRAREIFTRLADDATAPANLRARARALLGSLGGS